MQPLENMTQPREDLILLPNPSSINTAETRRRAHAFKTCGFSLYIQLFFLSLFQYRLLLMFQELEIEFESLVGKIKLKAI